MVSLFSNRVFLVTVSALMLAGIGVASFWLYLSSTHAPVAPAPVPVTVEDKSNVLKSLTQPSAERASTTQEQPTTVSEKENVLKSLQTTEVKTPNTSAGLASPAPSEVQDSEKAKLLQSLQSN